MNRLELEKLDKDDYIQVDKATCINLLAFLSHEYIDHDKYELVHELIKRMNWFVNEGH